MELLEKPEIKSKYEKCKYKVKYWEHHFKKKYGRLPSKLDIKEASNEIRYAYKTYFNLKSAALEQSFQDIDAFNFDDEDRENFTNTPNMSLPNINTNDLSKKPDGGPEIGYLEEPADNINMNSQKTWGAHLNNNQEPKSSTDSPKVNANSNFTQKLFKNSSFSKRNPRKSLSFSHRKSETKIELSSEPSISLSQPIGSNSISKLSPTCIDQNPLETKDVVSEEKKDYVRFTRMIEPVAMQSLNYMQTIVNDTSPAIRELDLGWMQRVAARTGTKLKNESLTADNYNVSQQILTKNTCETFDDDEDIINDSDEEDAKLYFSKRRKLNTQDQIHAFTNENSQSLDCELNNSKQDSNNLPNPTKVTNSRKSTRTRNTLIDLKPNDTSSEHEDDDYEEEMSKSEQKSKKHKLTKTKPSASISKRSSSKPAKGQVTEDEGHVEEDGGIYELEYSVKPRRVVVPRDRSFKSVLIKSKKEENEEEKVEASHCGIKSKDQMNREKFEKKVSSGNLNENFVRINIQKKIYVRGKKTMNFSKFKKKMWKQNKKNNALCGPNMNMGGCDGGKLTCFTCGQHGHFAAKCPNEEGAKLLPMVAEEDYCPFPTLEEASQLAKGSELAIRITRTQNLNKEEDILEDEDETSCSDEDGKGIDNECRSFFNDNDDAELLAETLKLEEIVRKYDESQLVDAGNSIKPYYQVGDDGRIPKVTGEVMDALTLFGYESFRPGQEKAIMRILCGESTLVTLSTGSGKSFCYQLPAYLYSQREPCIALVISPLVSLMEDQVVGIPKFLKAECLHTNKTKVQRERILKTISEGDLHILLVSPEAVVAGEKQTGFGSLLRKLPPIAFACIDEAHCVSHWSHNFRPSYLMICNILKERLGVRTILGLTATATRATCDSIVSHLAIADGQQGIIRDIPLPDNLRLTVSKDAHRDQALLNLLLSDRFANLKSVIIYCIRRAECERIAGFLRTSLKRESFAVPESNGKKRKKANVSAEPYHAGLSASKRRSIQNSFMRGDLRIVVATVAFGMGINKSDIRAVIHYNLPRSFESYVQEVGRAGRDGLPAHCHLFLDSLGRDEHELQRHIFADSIDRHVIRKLLAKIFVPCTCKGICPKHEVAFSIAQTVEQLDIPEENIATLLCYLELHEQKYIEMLSPAYVMCKVISYGNGNIIRKAAKDCPPLAMALAMFANKVNKNDNVLEFPIVDVAAAMGWDSGICKYKLKNLEWTMENNESKRSLITVQFSNLGFRLLAPGNLSEEHLDDALDTLHNRVVEQEKFSLLQLRSLHETVTKVAENSYRRCISDQICDGELILKRCIREYFDSSAPLDKFVLETKECDEGLIENDVRTMIALYKDNNFTGRALARIFYGISSPNYPAVVWGRCKYWRAHIADDFHQIVRIATRVILAHR